MEEPAKSFFFGPFQFDSEQRLLLRDGKPVSLSPKAISILLILLENHGKLVERDDLMNRVWPDLFVEEGNLTVNIFALRKVLDAGCNGGPTIETIPKRGYRFVVPVRGDSGTGSLESDVGATGKEPPEAVASTAITDVARGGTQESSAAAFPRYLTAIITGLLVISAILLWIFANPPAAPKVVRVVQLTHLGVASAVATDGVRLYIGEENGGRVSLVQMPAGGGEPVPVSTAFHNVGLLDISPDRSQLLVASFNIRSDPNLVWIMPLTGGSPHRLGDVVSESAKWSPAGDTIAFLAEDGSICLVNKDGTGLRKLAENGGGVESWSPDGDLLRFTRTNGATGGASLWEVRPDGTHLRPFLPERQNPTARWSEGQCCGAWTPDGKYFLFREAVYPKVGLWAIREKREFLQLRNPEPVEIYAAGFDIGSPVIDPNGHRVFLVGKNESRELVRYDHSLRQFVPLPLFIGAAQINGVNWSADGQWVGYSTYPDLALWRAKLDGSERLQLTFSPMQIFGAAWSPDGKRLAFHELEPRKPGKIALVGVDGGTPEILFANEPGGEDVPNWSPDGNTLMFARTRLDKAGNTIARNISILETKTRQVSALPGSDDMGPPSWSPDGRYVAAQSGDFRKLMLFDFHSRKWRELARGGYIHSPVWSRDSKFIYYQDTLAGEEQPIYRVGMAGGQPEEVASRQQLLRSDISSYRLAGLDPNGAPVAVIVRRNADIYALDLDLP